MQEKLKTLSSPEKKIQKWEDMETNKVPLVGLQDTYLLRMKPFLVLLRFKELFTSAFFLLIYYCIHGYVYNVIWH